MNKELFVSSTPHETKVGLVEDDLLAEVYLERENEYTLAGSIYKGRVTRVLPGMQSAFVDLGLERDAFLYVSDFMELEEHDEDVTDVIPAGRGVQDMRPQPAKATGVEGDDGTAAAEMEAGSDAAAGQDFEGAEEQGDVQPSIAAAAAPESSAGRDSQERERGGWRGRRRRRGGRRDGRGDGRDRAAEPRPAAPAVEGAPSVAPPRPPEPSRTQFGPPAGYQPILLPGESISKYRGLTQAPLVQERRSPGTETSYASAAPADSTPATPVAATFPDDEPIFASASDSAVPVAEPREHDDSHHAQE